MLQICVVAEHHHHSGRIQVVICVDLPVNIIHFLLILQIDKAVQLCELAVYFFLCLRLLQIFDPLIILNHAVIEF